MSRPTHAAGALRSIVHLHGGGMAIGAAMPDVFAASIRDVSGFAYSLR